MSFWGNEAEKCHYPTAPTSFILMKESLQKTYQLLKKYKEKNIIIFTSREEADEYVKNQLKNKPDLFL